MKRMSKKWLALMLAASLVISEGSFVSLAQTSNPSDTVVVTTVEEGADVSVGNVAEVSTCDGNDVSAGGVSVGDVSAGDVSVGDVSVNDVFKMFPGVAEGVTLGVKDAILREDLITNMENAGDFAEGEDCAANEILVMAESEELAEEYAAAFNGKVEKYYDGVATITLNASEEYTAASVKDAVMASADSANNLPVAWPNTIQYFLPIDVNAEQVAVEGFADVAVADDAATVEEASGLVAGETYDNFLAYNDPYLATSSASYQWFHTAIGSAYAWNAGYTGAGVKVAVLDSGVKTGHEDLNVTALSVSNVSGTDDTVGHGTHVCGLVGAKANNGKGGVGVAPGATIYSIRISGGESIYTSDVLEGLGMAKNRNVDIINMSLGSYAYNGTYAAKIKEMYDAGIAVFAAASNESTTAWSYPASYPGAISIGALDKSMQRVYFSNYGSSTDYAAPGYLTYSTYKTSTSSYESMSGTSMACPIAAGTAAVVLQYARSTGAFAEKGDSKDVENLLKVMNKGAVKAGSGTGKGYISLPKALGLGTSLKAPAAPKFHPQNGTYTAASMSIIISAEAGSTIYYSTNGKNPTYKNGLVTNGIKYSGAITVTGNKTVTVKAIAVSSVGLVSKVSSAKYTLKPAVSSISLAYEGGVNRIAPGKSVTIKATVNPTYAANKSLTWTVSPEKQGVTVKNGKVTASKSAVAGTYTVTATAKDGSGKKATASVVVVAASTNPVSKISKVTKGNVSLVNGQSKQIEIKIVKKDKTEVNTNTLTWVSENSAVAKVSSSASKNITITGVQKGKTNIIGTATDGSGVKIKIPVTVGWKVSSISLDSSSNQLAVGKSISIAADVNPADAANKKLNWTVTPAGQGVTVKNGKVTASKSAVAGTYTIKATAADGFGASASRTITVVNGAISKITMSSSKASVFRVNNGKGSATSTVIDVAVTGGNAANWEFINSAPGLVHVAKSGNNKVVVTATGKGVGTATITVKTTDGSNKKASCKVTVKNPASNLLLSAPAGRSYALAKGKSLQLKAVLESEYGKLDSSAKKLNWTSSNTSVATVNSSGKVTALSDTGSVTIYATATDGSKVTASVSIRMTADILGFAVANDRYGFDTATNWYMYKEDGASLYMIVYCDGSFGSDCITYSVSGNGGLGVEPVFGNGYQGLSFEGNKKGTYKVTISCTNGSTAKHTFSMQVR